MKPQMMESPRPKSSMPPKKIKITTNVKSRRERKGRRKDARRKKIASSKYEMLLGTSHNYLMNKNEKHESIIAHIVD